MKLRLCKLIFVPLLLLGACKAPDTDPATIGIIGGADGPTAVMVTAQISKPVLYTLLGTILAVVVGIVVWLCRKK